MADYVRKQLSFNTQNAEEMKMLQVLDGFKKNQTNVVVYALAEFAEKYNLFGKSPSELEQFVKNYPYIKSYLGGMMLTPRMVPVENIPLPEPVIQKKDENVKKQSSEKKEIPTRTIEEQKPDETIKGKSKSDSIQVSEAAKASMNNILSMFSNTPG